MINPEAIVITYGLGSAVAWGAADFSGGFASRKGNLMGVLMLSQFIGGILLALLAYGVSDPIPDATAITFGCLAGIFGGLGMIAFYRGLVVGRMGIVSPLSAVITAFLPICYSIVFEGLPPVNQLMGFFFVMVAVRLLSGSKESGLKMTKEEFFLSLCTGIGFGLFFVCVNEAKHAAVFWPLAIARLSTVCLLLCLIIQGKKNPKPVRGQWHFILITSLLDAVGNALFGMAIQQGRLDVATVLASLYPVATVGLANMFLKERLDRQQWIGVGFAFMALILISI